jgi:NADH-quinone oxidoreductase subunit A
MLEEYFPILVFLGVALVIGVAPIMLGMLLGPRRANAQKNAPYECGFEPFEDARMKFDVRYYLIAILFILFDLEVLFLLPWAIELKSGTLGALGFWGMMLFLTVLIIGFVYEWRKGALEWE